MTNERIEARYRIVVANFQETERGQVWRERLGQQWRPALDLLVTAFGSGLALRAQDLDREQVATLLTQVLPARLSGKEPYAADLPDLLEDFFIFLAEAEGLALQWEWTSAVDQNRQAYEEALQDDSRPRAAAPKVEPHRRPGSKLGRNDPCPCGSGRKYKSCCLKLG